MPTAILPEIEVVFGFWKPFMVKVKTLPASIVRSGKFVYVIDLSEFLPRQVYLVLWRPSLH